MMAPPLQDSPAGLEMDLDHNGSKLIEEFCQENKEFIDDICRNFDSDFHENELNRTSLCDTPTVSALNSEPFAEVTSDNSEIANSITHNAGILNFIDHNCQEIPLGNTENDHFDVNDLEQKSDLDALHTTLASGESNILVDAIKSSGINTNYIPEEYHDMIDSFLNQESNEDSTIVDSASSQAIPPQCSSVSSSGQEFPDFLDLISQPNTVSKATAKRIISNNSNNVNCNGVDFSNSNIPGYLSKNELEINPSRPPTTINVRRFSIKKNKVSAHSLTNNDNAINDGDTNISTSDHLVQSSASSEYLSIPSVVGTVTVSTNSNSVFTDSSLLHPISDSKVNSVSAQNSGHSFEMKTRKKLKTSHKPSTSASSQVLIQPSTSALESFEVESEAEKYRKMRKQNNEASRKSRAKKKQKVAELQELQQDLEKENERLKRELNKRLRAKAEFLKIKKVREIYENINRWR